MTDNKSDDKDMTAEERLNYLRERGVLVETAEERRRNQIKKIMEEPDDTTEYEDLKFVHVPHNDSLPLKELSVKVPITRHNSGDLLMEELKPWFKALSKKVDMSLFKDQATKHFGSTDVPQVSEEALASVAEQGQVEAFCLVQPAESNHFTSVNIYLDEVGMLKRLPLNKRAADFALQAGFNPLPKFYGDVFLGRIKNKPVLKNLDFKLNTDTSPNATWLKNAAMENLEHQATMNKITGRDEMQPSTDGENGVAKAEKGYSWTQTDEEIEIVVPLKSDDDSEVLDTKIVKKGGLKVKYFPTKIQAQFRGKDVLSLSFFARVDPDGCTWTLDSDKNGVSLVITCEKSDGMSWPRITA